MRTPLDRLLFLLRWQLYPLLLALPAHVRFVARGRHARTGPGARLRLALHAAWIHLRVECGHNPEEALRVMEEIAELPPERAGRVVECGAFRGGSTAKLSRAAALAGRRLVVCDSFEGLPPVGAGDHTPVKSDFRQGEYMGRLEDVQRTVARYGEPAVTEYLVGWFDQSLPRLAGQPIACAFWDVDLQDSFRSCIRALWPDVVRGSKVFLHDVDRPPVAAVFTDERWWRATVHEEPPRLAGALTGLGRGAPLLGYVTRE